MLRSAKLSSGYQATSQDLRSTKISELKSRCPGLLERVHDSEFCLSFSSVGVNYDLSISLPPGFPFVGPVLSVHPPAIHPLLDETSTVCGLTDLTAFSIHASVPDIVHTVLSQFIVTPLKKKEDIPQPGSKSMYMNGGNYRTSSIYQKVNELSTDDLKEWSSDDMKIKEFVETLPHIKAKREISRGMYETNEALAKSNISMREGLEQTRDQLLSRCEEFSRVRADFETNQETFRMLSETFTPESIKEGLRRAAQQAEEESDSLADQFLNKQLGVDDFLRSFMETRTRSHERSAKSEVLQKQLEQLYRF
ncbi:vacuolar protein sorting-associated protein 37A [Galendromus occidentalis]|uniref:Vacuolar protein sorting-associated protein 37A n=1 Tax=Galendromus occidentalis TaxID=34638 RepID=A0AAJ6VUM2_9ACAR|nr:vacuolar protein sorting-associated protein 37A [Galendromus occidentalis]